jgi:uncharacterized membrane protein YkoI
LAEAGLFEVAEAFDQEPEFAGSVPVKGDDEATLAGMAKIPTDSAVSEALKMVPGKVVKVELENEDGYLVYGVEIAKAHRQVADVKADSENRRVLKIGTDRMDHEEVEED